MELIVALYSIRTLSANSDPKRTVHFSCENENMLVCGLERPQTAAKSFGYIKAWRKLVNFEQVHDSKCAHKIEIKAIS